MTTRCPIANHAVAFSFVIVLFLAWNAKLTVLVLLTVAKSPVRVYTKAAHRRPSSLASRSNSSNTNAKPEIVLLDRLHRSF